MRVHLVGKIEVAPFLEERPIIDAGDLAQHVGRFIARDRFLADRHDVAMLADLRRLTFADMQIGSAFAYQHLEKSVDVSHGYFSIPRCCRIICFCSERA